MNLPLQDMITSTIERAKTKLAAEEPKKETAKVKNLLAFEKKEHGHIPTPTEEKEELEHPEKFKTASADEISDDYIEKLASSVEYISSHLEDISPPGPIAQALAKTAGPVGFAGPLPTSRMVKGEQQYKKDSATGVQAEDEAHTDLHKSHAHDGMTQLENNMMHPTNSKCPTKGPLVAGPNAHQSHSPNQAKTAGAIEKITELAAKHPRAFTSAVGAISGTINGGIAGAISADKGERTKGLLRGALAGGAVGGASGAALHGKSPTALTSALHHGAVDAAGAAAGAHKGKRLSHGLAGGAIGGALAGGGHLAGEHFMKSAAEQAKEHILLKLAGEDVMKANISGGGTVSPLAGKGQLKSMMGGDVSPAQAGNAVGSGDGNSARSHISSNQAAINMTKRDAKKVQVGPLGEILDQPAFSSAHDSKLQENLRNTGKAGVKIAGAADVKSVLHKIASKGCTCNGKKECQYCKMSEKLATMGMDMGMGMGSAPSGGGMAPMASSGSAPDGCTCGHTGECRVCKLNAALQSAKGGHHGMERKSTHEKDSNADSY
jgi:hypothetical protein